MSEVKLPPGYKQGPLRAYYTSQPLASVVNRAKTTNVDNFVLFTLVAAGVLIRLYKIPVPDEVVFDEVNFGGFVHQYFHGTFFIDVHPPLAKLLYYWVAVLFGYDGTFEFSQIGEKYDNVPYVAMRLVSGILGLLMVPLTYIVLRSNYCGTFSSTLGSVLVLVENSLITQSRFIFLDSPMLVLMVAAFAAFSKFRNTSQFSGAWHRYLALTGVFLGLMMSMKSSAILSYVWFGIVAALQLWTILGDTLVTNLQVLKHIAFRVFYLIQIPLAVYMAVFYVHFQTVPNVGRGAGPMSANFKASLQNFDRIRNQPVEVLYGSSVTIKHNEVGNYLHSHNFTYRSGSHEQQVTLYPFHTDFNNEWELHPKNKATDEKLYEQAKPIKDGDIVRLFHKATGKYLHVNNVRPPISEKDYSNEVSCHGNRTQLGDINYEFKIRIIDKKPHSKNNVPLVKLRATESVFQLYHQGTRCSVLSHKAKLPTWAFGQNEVLCINDPTIPNTLWYIEYNNHPLIDNDELHPRVDLGKYSFFQKFVEYHQVMWKFNSDMGDSHAYASRPETWPFLFRGVNYYSTDARVKVAGEQGRHIYYLGNPAIYYLGIMSVLFIGIKQIIYWINHLNPFVIIDEPTNVTFFFQRTMETIVGFLVHYQPYFWMKRELFLHHYLPALYFLILTLVYFIEFQVSKRAIFGQIIGLVVLVSAVYCFVSFAPLIYGGAWTTQQCNRAKWIGLWDFDCMSYSNAR